MDYVIDQEEVVAPILMEEIITYVESGYQKSILPKLTPYYKGNNYVLYNGDCLEVLSRLPENYVDMIFADPPYDLLDIPKIHELVFQSNLLSENGLLIIEHGLKTKLDDLLGFEQLRKYGNVNFSFFKPSPVTIVGIIDIKKNSLSLKGASNITIKGITIDQSVNEGITISNGTNILIAGCTIKNVNKYAIKIDGGNGNIVQSCDMFNLGEGGVWLSGGNENVEPRIPAGHKVVNNHIYNFSQLVHIYTPAVNAGFSGGGGGGHHTCVGNYVAHNLIHDTPHGGIIYGSWDNVFEYNEIFRMCTVSNDLGAFYSYDQYNRSGNNTFAYNFIHNSDDGDGIYFDHDHFNMHVYGNVLALNSRGGKRGTGFLFKHGEMPKTSYGLDCYNNIALNCGFGFEFVTSESVNNNWKDNISVNCRVPFEYKFVGKDGKEVKQDASVANGKNMVYSTDPGFEDMSKMNFKLKHDAQVYKDLPNFNPIPMDKIGLYKDDYRKILPTDNEINRFSNGDGLMSLNQAVLDRGN